MDQDAREVIQPALRAGEKLLWAGRPKRGLRLGRHDALLVPVSLVWTGFFVLWEWHAVVSAKSSFFFKLWGVPFLLVGLYLMAGRYFVDALARRRTAYGMTDTRIIVIGGLWSSSVHSHSIAHLPHLHLVEQGDGTGTIDLREHDTPWAGRHARNIWHDWSPARLNAIPDARDVFQRILALQAAASTAAGPRGDCAMH